MELQQLVPSFLGTAYVIVAIVGGIVVIVVRQALSTRQRAPVLIVEVDLRSAKRYEPPLRSSSSSIWLRHMESLNMHQSS